MEAIHSPRPRSTQKPPHESSSGPCSTLVHHPIETPHRVYAPPGEKFCDISLPPGKNFGDIFPNLGLLQNTFFGKSSKLSSKFLGFSQDEYKAGLLLV